MARRSEGGLFITFEGPEGAGKSEQIARLAARLGALGTPVVATREPGGTRLGESVRDLLLAVDPDGVELRPESEALLFCAARAELVSRVIRPALASGHIVLCDRFSDSTLAYQGYGRGLDLDALGGLIAMAAGGLRPDVTVLFDVPVEIGLARRASSRAPLTRIDAAGVAFHERVRAGFLAMAAAEPERWHRVDAEESIEAVEAAVWQALSGRLLPLRTRPRPGLRRSSETPLRSE